MTEMNKRIFDLAFDAIVKYPASEEWVFTNEELETFVQSIIDECCTALEHTERHRRDYFIAKIREHFEDK